MSILRSRYFSSKAGQFAMALKIFIHYMAKVLWRFHVGSLKIILYFWCDIRVDVKNSFFWLLKIFTTADISKKKNFFPFSNLSTFFCMLYAARGGFYGLPYNNRFSAIIVASNKIVFIPNALWMTLRCVRSK